MNTRRRRSFYITIVSLMLTGSALAQRISFGLYSTDNISLAPLNSGELNFNTKQPILLAGQSVNINLTDDAAAVISISGSLDQDVTISVSAPSTLDLNTSHIPLSVKLAYSNTGASNYLDAKLTAIELPTGFTSITFPMRRRANGLPTPPPTPAHSGRALQTGTAYLFIYGLLGPVPLNAELGYYNNDFNIRVEYTVYP